jgi:transposase
MLTPAGPGSAWSELRPYRRTDLGFAYRAGYADRVNAQRRAAYKGGRSCWSLLPSSPSISTPRRAGALTRIHIPTEQEEAVRDLLRCREDIRADLLRARHRLSKFLLRHGRRFTGTKKAWTRAHDVWLRAQTWPFPALTQTHEAYLRAVDEIRARLHTVDEQLQACLTLEPLATRARCLRCFRGIDDLTALTIAAELSDPRRFPTARSVMALSASSRPNTPAARNARAAVSRKRGTHIYAAC